MDRAITGMYFSPTGFTKTIVMELAGRVASLILPNGVCREIDFTQPENRKVSPAFSSGDVVVCGVPVFAGRVPNVLLKYLGSLRGNGAVAVAVVTYGHRAYEDSLIELVDILIGEGFRVIGGGAFLAEHSLSDVLALNRPDAEDKKLIAEFSVHLANKLIGNNAMETAVVKGNRPYQPYYSPVNRDGSAVKIKAFKPVTNASCVKCGICARLCPMGAIDPEEVSSIPGVCIKCGACIKKCPTGAKHFDDEVFLAHIREIEKANLSPRKESEYFL